MTTAPTATVERITPQRAEEMLANNTNNRTVRKQRVKQYADMMRRDQWPFSGDPIRFDANGRLIDGQHRLLALVEAGKTLDFVVIRDLATDVFDVIDSGLNRTPGDVIYLSGGVSGNVAAAAIRLVIAIEAGLSPTDTSAMKLVTRTDLRDFYEAHSNEVDTAVRIGMHLYVTVGGNATANAAFQLLARRQGYTEKVDEFTEALLTGEHLAGRDVRKMFRDWMMRRLSSDRIVNLGTMIRVFNYFLANDTVTRIQSFSTYDTWPQIEAKSRRTKR